MIVATIQTIQDFNKYSFITESFPTITKKTTFKEKGADLFLKITGEITKKMSKNLLRLKKFLK